MKSILRLLGTPLSHCRSARHPVTEYLFAHAFFVLVFVLVIQVPPSSSAANGVFDYAAPQKICEIDCRQIKESSGLAVSRLRPGLFWTHNDSGDQPRLYAFDQTGKHLGTCRVEGAQAIDWEDMASFDYNGRASLLIGDVGDNRRQRKTATLFLVDEAAPGTETLKVRQTVRFRYDRGPQDCESVGFDPTTGQVLLVAKNWALKAQVYLLHWPDETDTVQTARYIGDIHVPGATAMDISPDGRRAVVLCYGNAYEYRKESHETWQQAFGRAAREIQMPERRQGETVCFGADGRTLYLTSETQPTPLFRVAPSE